MKGQYLAIETMLTFGMGLALAISTISVFTNYQNQVMETTTEKEVRIVQSEIRNTIFQLKSSDSGNIEVNLPSEIGGSDYEVSFNEGLAVSVNRNTYEKKFPGLSERYTFEGNADGGTVNIYKQQNNFVLRSG